MSIIIKNNNSTSSEYISINTIDTFSNSNYVYTITDSIPTSTLTTILPKINASSNIEMKLGKAESNKKEISEVSPKLYFSFVKSKLEKIHKDKLKRRLEKLIKYVEYARNSGQVALFEESARKAIEIAREQEAHSCGIDYFIEKQYVDKYINNVKDRVVKSTNWSEFPRIAPKEVVDKLNYLRENNIFDEYKVVYMDYTKEVIKSTKQKVIEKDPILFGVFNSKPDFFYFIIDWEDDFCSLTFNTLVEKVGKLDEKFQLGKIPVINDKYIESLQKELDINKEKLNNTNRSNFRDTASSIGSKDLNVEETHYKAWKWASKLKQAFTRKK